MPSLDDPSAPFVTLPEIARDWLHLKPANLHKRIERGREMALDPPEPVFDFGKNRDKVFPNTHAHRGEWMAWNQRFRELNRAIGAAPHCRDYSTRQLRRLYGNGELEAWLDKLAGAIHELIAVGDPAARHIRIPPPPGKHRLRAIDASQTEVTPGYVDNVRAWAIELTRRIRLADEAMRAWPHAAETWDALLTRYLTVNWEAVLARCESWRPLAR